MALRGEDGNPVVAADGALPRPEPDGILGTRGTGAVKLGHLPEDVDFTDQLLREFVHLLKYLLDLELLDQDAGVLAELGALLLEFFVE